MKESRGMVCEQCIGFKGLVVQIPKEQLFLVAITFFSLLRISVKYSLC